VCDHWKLSFVYFLIKATMTTTMNSTRMDDMELDLDDLKGSRSQDTLFFYCHDNFFKGVLVRLKVTDKLNMSLKLYTRQDMTQTDKH